MYICMTFQCIIFCICIFIDIESGKTEKCAIERYTPNL